MELGVAEAKDRFSEVIERAEHGEPVTITRHGKAVAVINPAQKGVDPDEIRRAFAELRTYNSELRRPTDDEIVSYVQADRRY